MQIARPLLVALWAAAAAAPAAAQNVNAPPYFGTFSLAAGFTPDPHVVAVRSGGRLNAESFSPSCQGFISHAPDVWLNYQAGSAPLIISVASDTNTTLVVNGPDGIWYCDDDGGVNGFNPMVRLNSPQSGRYAIWVGTYGNSSLHPANLQFSELGSQ